MARILGENQLLRYRCDMGATERTKLGVNEVTVKRNVEGLVTSVRAVCCES